MSMKKSKKYLVISMMGCVLGVASGCAANEIPEVTNEVKETGEVVSDTESLEINLDSSSENTADSGEVVGANDISPLKVEYPYVARALTAVNIHADSGQKSEVLGILPEGAEVSVERNIEGWEQFSFDGNTGYVLKKYLIPDEYVAANNQYIGKLVDTSWIDPSKPMIALTFDDGPKAEVTNQILDVLEANDAHATFFMQGSRVVGDNNDCVRRMLEQGCELGNHTYTHDYLDSIELSEIRSVIRKCDYMVEETVKAAPTVFRPPGGNRTEAIASEVGSLGFPMIIWSIDTLDYETKDPDNTYKVVMDNAKSGDIVLMHDTYEETAEAARRIIPALKEKGFQMVTVSEMAQVKKYPMIPGDEVYNMR